MTQYKFEYDQLTQDFIADLDDKTVLIISGGNRGKWAQHFNSQAAPDVGGEIYGYVYQVNNTYTFFSNVKPPDDAYDAGTLVAVKRADGLNVLQCPLCLGHADNGQPEGNTDPDNVYMCKKCCLLEDLQRKVAQLEKSIDVGGVRMSQYKLVPSDQAVVAAMLKAKELGVKMLASDCEQILQASSVFHDFMECGHHKSLLLISAETGEPLYCEYCDMRQQRNDLNIALNDSAKRIAELEADKARLVDACNKLIFESEEYDFDDGIGKGALQEYWDALTDILAEMEGKA